MQKIKMKNKKYFFIVLFLLRLSRLYSQENKTTAITVLKKASDSYNNKEYVSYNSKYVLYLDYTSNKVYEQYAGFTLKKNKVNYSKIKNTEFVVFNNSSIKINHDEKALIIEKTNNPNIQNSPLGLETYLKGFNYKLSTNKDYFICELTPAGKMSQIMMHKVILYIRKTDYSIAKETLFLVEKMQSKDAKGKPILTVSRLEITFSPRIKNEKVDNLLIKKENYFTEKGNNIIVSKRLSAYKLYKS